MSERITICTLDYLKPEDVDRFWSHVTKTDDCWLFRESMLNPDGYGQIRVGSKTFRAHRISWELTFGRIPDGMCVCHDCPTGDNPACVRPDHMFLGTQADNVRDMFAKGRRGTVRGAKVHTAILTDEQVIALRYDFAEGAASADLATKYGITIGHVTQIARGRRWSHLPTLKKVYHEDRLPKPNARLTDVQVRDIRRRLASGEKGVVLAKEFGVSTATVSLIRSRKLRPNVA